MYNHNYMHNNSSFSNPLNERIFSLERVEEVVEDMTLKLCPAFPFPPYLRRHYHIHSIAYAAEICVLLSGA